MAYPVIDAPYGFKAINELNGLPYAGATRQFPIARSYATSIFYGDLVQLQTDGTLILTSYSAASSPTSVIAGAIGMFVGCQFTNPTTRQLQFSQYYPASTAYANQSFIGTNVYAVTGVAGSTTTGNSKMAVSGDGPSNGTGNVRVASSSLPFRVVAVVPETAYAVTGTGTSASTTITLDAAVTGLQAGMAVICPAASAGGQPGNYNYVTNVNGTTVTVGKTLTASTAGSQFTFIGYPEVLVKWNQGWHSYQYATALA
ncbi:hypothetical protein EB118_20315 [bacterium]|nr:hypothetical protein [bacterium]